MEVRQPSVGQCGGSTWFLGGVGVAVGRALGCWVEIAAGVGAAFAPQAVSASNIVKEISRKEILRFMLFFP